MFKSKKMIVNNLEFEEILPSGLSDWKKNSLHSVAPYAGKIRPEFASALISRFAVPGKCIYDPFCGSGTVLLEGWRHGYEVIGNDLSKYAYVVSMAKMNPYSDVEFMLGRLKKYSKIIQSATQIPDIMEVPEWISSFFHPRTLMEICNWINILSREDEWYFLACLIGILHHQRPGYLSYPSSNSAPYLRNKKYPIEQFPEMYYYKNVQERLTKKVMRSIKDASTLDYNINRYVGNINSLYEDLGHFKIGTIITSPPYMKALSYARDNRMRLWFLGTEGWRELDKEISPSKRDFLNLMQKSFEKWGDVQSKGDRCIIIIGDMQACGSEKKTLSEYLFDYSNDSYKIIYDFYDPIPESKKIVKGNNSISREKIIVFERR